MIIAIETLEHIDSILTTEERIEAVIDGKKYLSHPDDNAVMLDHKGEPTFLLYPAKSKLKRIHYIAIDRIQLHWQFELLLDQKGGSIHLRKSKLLPGLEIPTIRWES